MSGKYESPKLTKVEPSVKVIAHSVALCGAPLITIEVKNFWQVVGFDPEYAKVVQRSPHAVFTESGDGSWLISSTTWDDYLVRVGEHEPLQSFVEIVQAQLDASQGTRRSSKMWHLPTIETSDFDRASRELGYADYSQARDKGARLYVIKRLCDAASGYLRPHFAHGMDYPAWAKGIPSDFFVLTSIKLRVIESRTEREQSGRAPNDTELRDEAVLGQMYSAPFLGWKRVFEE